MEDVLEAKNVARKSAQLLALFGGQPPVKIGQMALLDVEGKSLNVCGGVPTWKPNDDHGPSLPSLDLINIRIKIHTGGALPVLRGR